MPKKILIITGIYPPDTGGPAKFSEEFAEWLFSEKLEAEVLTYSDKPSQKYSNSKIVVHKVSRNLSLPVRILRFVRFIRTLKVREKRVLVVGAFIESYLASLIYGFSYIAKIPGDVVWERARNSRVTNLEIDSFQFQPLNFKYRIFRAFYSKSLKRADKIVVPSLGLYKLCQGWGISTSKLKLIYNSVDPIAPNEVSVNREIYDLVTVCRLVPWKGVDELINYVGKRNLSLLIIGGGPEREKLEELARTINANVKFVGEVSQRTVSDLILQGKIFVLNSYYEGLPHALIEARAAGKLSVARAGTGSAEVIHDDQDGFLIRPDRPLTVTLDLALRLRPASREMIELAKLDSEARFSKVRNYPKILNLLMGE